MNKEQVEKKKKLLPENFKKYTLIFDRKALLIVAGFSFFVLFPLGFVLYANNTQLQLTELDYTECKYLAKQDFQAPPANITGIEKWKYDNSTKICTLQFRVIDQLLAPVHMYIRVSNFYANHRLYVKSLNSEQLNGKVFLNAKDLKGAGVTDCGFLTYANCNTAKSQGSWLNNYNIAENNPDCQKDPLDKVIENASEQAQYYPCGLIANSMFTDDISNLKCVDDSCKNIEYTFSEKGIAWPEDLILYKKTAWVSSSSDGKPLNDSITKNLIPPPQWRQAWPEKWGNGYNSTNLPDLQEWERFMVWMRKAGLPTARKFWGLNSTRSLDAGLWEVSVKDVWDASRFSGTKSLVYAESGILGPKNDFLAYIFLGFGALSLFFAIFLVSFNPRPLAPLDRLSWKKNQ